MYTDVTIGELWRSILRWSGGPPLPGDHVTRDQYLAISRFIRRNILFIILFTIEYLQSLAPHIWPADTDQGADSIRGLIIWLRCWWEWQIDMMDSEKEDNNKLGA